MTLSHMRQNVATRIIEDFMLMANETVAQEYCTEEIPFVYRTHDNPDPEKVESLLTLLHNQGVKIQKAKEEITPKEIQQIIESIEGLPNEAMISRLVLRSMKQAKYTTECSGHFGLAAKYYCHFTSPIRRYPDLQIHRIIKENLRGRLTEERVLHYEKILPEVAGAVQCAGAAGGGNGARGREDEEGGVHARADRRRV